MKVLVVVAGFVFFFFGLDLVKRLQILNFMKKPPLTNCLALSSHHDEAGWKSIAFQEWKSSEYALKDEDFDIGNAKMPHLHCFC